jgi:hypothetical protein
MRKKRTTGARPEEEDVVRTKGSLVSSSNRRTEWRWEVVLVSNSEYDDYSDTIQYDATGEISIGLTDEDGGVEVFTVRGMSDSASEGWAETHLKKHPALETYWLGAVKKRAPVDFNPPNLT